MALSAISSISGGGLPPLYRPSQVQGIETGPLARVQAIPPLAVREDSRRGEDARAGSGQPPRPAGTGPSAGRGRLVDPRFPDSILARGSGPRGSGAGREGAPAGERRTASQRLDELLGQKAGVERRQAEAKGARTAEVVAELAQLKSRDSEVRAHEAAHMAAGGRYVTGGASYSYQRGPDGVEYAVGGEVGIDTSSVPGKPEETVQKMRTIRAAALAPSDPSAADIAVAAAAAQAEAQALAEIAQASAEAAQPRPEPAQARSQELAGRYSPRPGASTPPGNGVNMVA
jgi:hypothetical protein